MTGAPGSGGELSALDSPSLQADDSLSCSLAGLPSAGCLGPVFIIQLVLSESQVC